MTLVYCCVAVSHFWLRLQQEQKDIIESMLEDIQETTKMQTELTLQYSVPLLPTGTPIDLDKPIEPGPSVLDMFSSVAKRVGGSAGSALQQAAGAAGAGAGRSSLQ